MASSVPAVGAEAVLAAEKRLSKRLSTLKFRSKDVSHVYNPLEYAWETHEDFTRKYCCPGGTSPEVLMLGMNPGPWGMSQTGVPFGGIPFVRDWMQVRGRSQKPVKEHPNRLVEGLACPKKEVSGARLWGWAKLVGDAIVEAAGKDGLTDLVQEGGSVPAVVPSLSELDAAGGSVPGTPPSLGLADALCTPCPVSPSALAFFSNAFVYSYCPLAFMASSGRNIVPEKLLAADRAPLLEACAETFREVVAAVKPKYIVGIGKWAEARAHDALDDRPEFGSIPILSIIHPSPANPAAHKDWAGNISQQMMDAGCVFHAIPSLPWGTQTPGAEPVPGAGAGAGAGAGGSDPKKSSSTSGRSKARPQAASARQASRARGPTAARGRSPRVASTSGTPKRGRSSANKDAVRSPSTSKRRKNPSRSSR